MAENSIPPFNQDLVASEVVRQALSDRFPSQKSGKQVTYSLEQAGIKTLRTRIRIGHPGQQIRLYAIRRSEIYKNLDSGELKKIYLKQEHESNIATIYGEGQS